MYYVYVYLDPRNKGKFQYEGIDCCFLYEPFYVGKGQKKRYKSHLYEYGKRDNPHKYSKIQKIKKCTNLDPHILLIKHFDIEQDAYLFEDYCIDKIGTILTETGSLTNLVLNSGKVPSGKDHPNYIVIPYEVVKEIIEMYVEKKMYMKHIARFLNLNELKIKKILLENNIDMRIREPINKIKISKEIENMIIKNYEVDILSIEVLAEKYKIPYSRVHAILTENNITIRDNKRPQKKEDIEKRVKARKGKYVGKNSKMYLHIDEETTKLIIELRMVYKKSLPEISKLTGIKYGKLYKYVLELNLTKNIQKKDKSND